MFRLILIACALVTVRCYSAEKHYDVVVYGGVPCGIAAAIHASRENVSVLLIEPTKHVGGLLTSGINTAETEHMLKWTIGGFADEFYQRLGQHYGTNKPEYFFESSVAEKVYLDMLQEAKVPIHYGAHVTEVVKTNNTISKITLQDGASFTGKLFIDASYEGDLMARAGISYTFGREAKTEFDEEAAGIRFDKTPIDGKTVDENGNLLPGISGWAKDLKEGDAHPAPMNYNFRVTVTKNQDAMAPFPEPQNYDRKRYALLSNWLKGKEKIKPRAIVDFYARRNDKYEMNNKQSAIISLGHFGGQFHYSDASYEDREKIIQDHLDYTLGLIHFLRTDADVPESAQKEMQAFGLHKDEFADNGNFPYQLYVREARRMKGAYVVRQQDVQTERRKPDSIGMSSHFIDCHHVQRLAVSENQFINEGRIWRKGYAYQIPYRSITPKKEECANLLVPGAASYTHVAYCTLRLESVWMITGHAAGVAAAELVKNGNAVQDLDVTALQDKLREQKQVIDFIPGQPERCEKLNGPPEF